MLNITKPISPIVDLQYETCVRCNDGVRLKPFPAEACAFLCSDGHMVTLLGDILTAEEVFVHGLDSGCRPGDTGQFLQLSPAPGRESTVTMSSRCERIAPPGDEG